MFVKRSVAPLKATSLFEMAIWGWLLDSLRSLPSQRAASECCTVVVNGASWRCAVHKPHSHVRQLQGAYDGWKKRMAECKYLDFLPQQWPCLLCHWASLCPIPMEKTEGTQCATIIMLLKMWYWVPGLRPWCPQEPTTQIWAHSTAICSEEWLPVPHTGSTRISNCQRTPILHIPSWGWTTNSHC